MNRMSEQELLKLWGMGDRLIADVAKPSHVADEIFAWSFPQMAPIVVSWILRVFGSSGHYLAARTCKTNKEPVVVCADRLSDA